MKRPSEPQIFQWCAQQHIFISSGTKDLIQKSAFSNGMAVLSWTKNYRGLQVFQQVNTTWCIGKLCFLVIKSLLRRFWLLRHLERLKLWEDKLRKSIYRILWNRWLKCQYRPFNQAKWDSSCDEIVECGNYLKFSQNPKLKAILLGTEDKFIVEASPSDRIWGIGFDAEHAGGKENEWGANKLGEALMRVREKLSEHWVAANSFLAMHSNCNEIIRRIVFYGVFNRSYGLLPYS